LSDQFITQHRIHIGDARDMAVIADESVHLVVTSPPYPMIAMWDALFGRLDRGIARALDASRPREMFDRMHALLDPVWDEIYRVLRPGGFACINIGDAVRSFNGEFGLFANHVRILGHLQQIGFTCLPGILWRKPTNAPTKFMGSGMLPAGAYVTLEHEYILIVRKGGKRHFTTAEQARRRASAIFWEERNVFYSDIWTDIRGAGQWLEGDGARARSAAFPFALAWRLILMYAIKGDTVLDPFWGTGTTALAAATAGRSSVGFEIDPGLGRLAGWDDPRILAGMHRVVHGRLERHVRFARDRQARRGPLKYRNRRFGFRVMTQQEQDLTIDRPAGIDVRSAQETAVAYEDTALHWTAPSESGEPPAPVGDPLSKPLTANGSREQLSLFGRPSPPPKNP
jgi:DNA modification methylase